MSWDATLIDDRGHEEGDWNYTHNCNRMIAAALEVHGIQTEPCGGPLGPAIGPAWWRVLDGKEGGEGAAYLERIIKGLESDPARFRAMNPDNGWGDYDSLLRVLNEMLNAVPAWPTVWRCSG